MEEAPESVIWRAFDYVTFGWIEEMRAILDEYGVVIDGNRRMIVAELWFNSWLGEAPPPPLRIGSECD
jgi:hypothetical protein